MASAVSESPTNEMSWLSRLKQDASQKRVRQITSTNTNGEIGLTGSRSKGWRGPGVFWARLSLGTKILMNSARSKEDKYKE